MDSKRFQISFLFILSACIHASLGEPSMSTTCVKKLLPCQPYLRHASSTPPAICCDPLKQLVADDAHCLCAIFNNPEILKSLNVTHEEALALVKTCGANADMSICKNNAAGATPAGSPSATGNSSASASPSTGGNGTSVNSAYARSVYNGFGAIAILSGALIIHGF